MRRSQAELVALGAVLLISLPLIAMFVVASKDGVIRHRQSALRALLGNEVFELLNSGRATDQHYMGNNRRAPDFTLRDRNNRPWRLADQRGRVVVMNFWTATCRPCLEEMPSLEHLARIVRERDDITLVTVSTDRDWDTIATVVGAQSPLLVLQDRSSAIVRGRFGSRLFPETWVIDREGFVRLRVDGRRDWSSAVAINVFESYL